MSASLMARFVAICVFVLGFTILRFELGKIMHIFSARSDHSGSPMPDAPIEVQRSLTAYPLPVRSTATPAQWKPTGPKPIEQPRPQRQRTRASSASANYQRQNVPERPNSSDVLFRNMQLMVSDGLAGCCSKTGLLRWDGFVSDRSSCRSRCESDAQCVYYSFGWPDSKWCSNYAVCSMPLADGPGDCGSSGATGVRTHVVASNSCKTIRVPVHDPHGGAHQAPTICCDWMDPHRLPTRTLAAPPQVNSGAGAKVLAFIPLGQKQAFNIKDMCSRLVHPTVDAKLFLGFYDNSQPWYQALPWYDGIRSSVRYTATRIGAQKSRFFADEVVHGLFSTEIKREFSHIWLMDDDLIFPSVPYIAYFIDTVVRSKSLIAQPAVVNAHWEFLRPHPTCGVCATDFVEIMLPLMQSHIVDDLFGRLLRPQAQTDWGLDLIWCKYAEAVYKTPRPCLVVNSGEFRHPIRGSTPANYSRVTGLEEESCARSVHRSLISDIKMLGCLKEDRFQALPGPLEALSDTHLSKRLRVYVYNLEALGVDSRCTQEDAPTVVNNFEWERHVEGELRELF